MVKAGYPGIGLAAVYKTIQLLLDLYLIDRVNFDNRVVRYEIGSMGLGTAKHRRHRLICASFSRYIGKTWKERP